ncbi:MAG: hypothetical protein F4Y84_04765 [Caldilineaceae bacterium SB0665_bin_25]|nr:hypothetical protein [Caldilineaceae bacterium SB0665_bin_25]
MRASNISSGPGVGVAEGVGVGDGVGVLVGMGVGVTDGVSARLVASASAVCVSRARAVAVARNDSCSCWTERVSVAVAAVVSDPWEPGEGVVATWAAANFTCGIPPPKSTVSRTAASSAAASAKARSRAPPLRRAPFRWLRCWQRNTLIKSDYTRSTHLSE